MTICLVTNESASTGGIKTFNEHFASLFPAHGHHVILLMADTSATITEDAVEHLSEGFTKVILGSSYHQERGKLEPYFRPGGCDAPKYIAMGLAFRKWLFKHKDVYKIDILEVSDHGGLGIFLCDRHLPPVVLTNHASNYHLSQYNHMCRDEHGTVIRKLELLSFNHADAIITHSSSMAAALQPLTRKKIFTALMPWQPKEVRTPQASQDIVVVAQLQVIKGPLLLLQALDLKKPGGNMVVKWFGNDTYTLPPGTSVRMYLENKFPELINNRIFLEPARTHLEILAEIAKASFVVIPSLWETFGYVALEAASMGKPLIMTRTTGAADLFENGVHAMIVEPEPQPLAEALFQLENSLQLRRDLGRKASEMILEVFQPQGMVASRIEVYETVIRNREPQPKSFPENIAFLKKYLTPARKLYYFTRAKIKSAILLFRANQ